MDKQRLIGDLQGTQRPLRLVVDKQSATDIINTIVAKHKDCAADYDRIAHYFEGGDVWDVCYRLWKFCKKNFNYVIEDGKAQFASSPIAMLTGGDVDCKNYALFIGGVLDALRRRGYDITFQYRFVAYDLVDVERPWKRPDPGHVFIVANPATDDIWVDPVLDEFNQRTFYWYRITRTPRTGTVGCIGRVPQAMGTVVAENQLLSEVRDYQQGLIGANQLTLQTNTFNKVTAGIIKGVAVAAANAVFPGAGAAVLLVGAGWQALADVFPPGSAAARLLSDWANFNVVGLWNDIWGRTYNTDQYWGAVFYKFYVLGQNVTDQNQVSDGDVLPALKWFIDRTGVFISGREHIIALTKSPTTYMNYYGVNSDTTTDSTLVQAAYGVASQYWPQPGNFDPSLMGAWKNTIGVYDRGLIQLATQYGLTPEQYARQTGSADAIAQQAIADQAAAAAAAAAVSAPTSTDIIPGIPDPITIGGAALLLYMGFSK